MDKKFIFGIDLGTTYSCIAYVDETGRPTVVKNLEGDATTPSVVCVNSANDFTVGDVAKDNAVIEPERTVSLVKTLIGRSKVAKTIDGEDYSPEVISSRILMKLASDASAALDTEVKDVVITCPAYFGAAEREATKNAGIIAGLNVLQIISEPTAAAFCYGCTRNNGEKTILIYDLGGGTFDVTVMRLGEGRLEVICSDGNHELGGKDWDEALMAYLASEFCSAVGEEVEFDDVSTQELRSKAEKAKMMLTSRKEVPVALEIAGLRERIPVTRETFDSITSSLLAQTIEKTNACIEVAKSKGYTIDEILLVGGSTKMPQVPAIVKETYGLEPKVFEPDEAVAKGAAIYALGAYEMKVNDFIDRRAAGELTEEEEVEAEKYSQKATVSTMSIPGLSGGITEDTIVVATTKSYAIEVVVNDIGPKCFNMIMKNKPMEGGIFSFTSEFGTSVHDQRSAELKVYESDFLEEYYDIIEDYLIGQATLELPAGLPKGSKIEVTFTLTKEGILEITGVDLSSQNKIQARFEVNADTIMSAEEVAAAASTAININVE